MTDKGREGGHSAKPVKAAPDPGRCMHPGAKVMHQAATTKSDPTRKDGGKRK